MKTALKIVGILVGLLVVAGVGGYLAFLSPPAPEDVCDNVARIAKKESGVDVPAKMKSDCVTSAAKAPEFGRAVWVKKLKCMRDASSSKELDQCAERKSL
jgi:hypothetical protein